MSRQTLNNQLMVGSHIGACCVGILFEKLQGLYFKCILSHCVAMGGSDKAMAVEGFI